MRIGDISVESPVLLAPMAGTTDLPFRRLARHYGAGLAATEMTTADTSLWRSEKSRYRLRLEGDPRPRTVQIAGSDPLAMAAAAQAAVEAGADIVDINMGCPAKKVCRKLAGSALLRDENQVAAILSAVVGSVGVPVTLKTRTGWDPDNRNGVRIARLAEDCGVQALAIHGRTRACRFAGSAEYETIARIVEAVSIPVIANGDIDGPEKALEVLRLTGAAAVMIGRAAQGRPWIFRDVLGLLRDGRHARPLDGNELRDIIVAHLEDMHRFYGDERGVRVARKHLSWYCRYLRDADAYRQQVLRVESAREQVLLTECYFGDSARDGVLAA
ncbi:MAG: tRNA dihydrouridine synthase DusB [Gammaproteobacteria bacterium]|jgi:tRNA-dihydrouridine synthase B